MQNYKKKTYLCIIIHQQLKAIEPKHALSSHIPTTIGPPCNREKVMTLGQKVTSKKTHKSFQQISTITTAMNKTILNKIFGFDPKSMQVHKEVLGGVTTFLTMAYILAVNPLILSATGMDSGAVFTATAVSSVVATLVMALYAKLPFALAPGMGMNAFFAYTIVLLMGYNWQFALTAVLLEGILFILLSASGIRQKIIESIPPFLQQAIAPGIGLFIAFLGLKDAGIIVSDATTYVKLGDMHTTEVLLSMAGVLLGALLLIKRVTGALLIAILFVTLLGIPFGITHYGGIVSVPPDISPLFCQFEWDKIATLDMAVCVFTLLFCDMFDTIGTLIGVSRNTLSTKGGETPNLNKALMADAIGTTAGAMLGTSTVTTYVESAAGCNVGGRSGMTAFVTACCFGIALFFAPLFLAIPKAATGTTLFIVGLMMSQGLNKIDFKHYEYALPSFICIIGIPLTNSISDGIMLSLIAYVLLAVLGGHARKVTTGSYILAALFILKYIFI